MIPRPSGFMQMVQDIIPRLDVVHGDVGRMVAVLGDAAAEVWTVAPVTPPTPGVSRYSVSGWRAHFAGEQARFIAYRADGRTQVSRTQFADVDARCAAYLEALPRVLSALDTLLARYPDAQTVPQAVAASHRAALASVLTAELE